jgi:hypothetical protein
MQAADLDLKRFGCASVRKALAHRTHRISIVSRSSQQCVQTARIKPGSTTSKAYALTCRLQQLH